MHFLWRMRFLPARNLQLAKGEVLEIISFGEYNKNESGPDFFHAKLIIDGVVWFGNVEFHLKASDWYKHQHHADPAYDHVILHVVWENDKDVVCQDKVLPTLILSQYVITDFSSSHIKTKDGATLLPCSFGLEEIDTIYVEREKEAALTHRLHRKTADFDQNGKEGYAQLLYELIATAFGAKVNKEPFWQLTREIPVIRLLKMGQNKRAHALMNASGVYDKMENGKRVATEMKTWQWKRKGLHPIGAPEIRVEQFAYFIQHFNFDFGFIDLPVHELLNYVRSSFALAQKANLKYSKSFQDLIIMNAFVPFLWSIGEKRGEQKWQNKAIEILETLPAESNHLTKFLKTAGFTIQTAYDSQSLMELYAIRCSRKKCLTCAVGNKILGR